MKEIRVALAEVSAERMTLVIAHRLPTVVDTDENLVLDHRRVIERGTHRDLLLQGGAYAHMWACQQEAAQAEEILKHAREDEAVE